MRLSSWPVRIEMRDGARALKRLDRRAGVFEPALGANSWGTRRYAKQGNAVTAGC